jgi:signal transduction histidine kinase
MFHWIGHISPKTKILFLASLLILLPSALLSLFGLHSINQKVENLRAHYRSTVGLVRDKMEGEVLRAEEGVSTFILKSPPEMECTRDLQDWLGRLQSTHAFLTQPFLLHADGGVLSTMLSKGWTRARPAVVLRSSVAAAYFHSAEAAELAARNIPEANKLYRLALGSTTFDADRAVINARIGRCYFKLGRYHEGIEEYRNVLALEGSLPDIGSLPSAAVALSQISDGYQALGDSLSYRASVFQLYEFLLRSPWDIESGEYLFYLTTASEAVPRDATRANQIAELERQKRSILDQAQGLDLLTERVIPKIRSDPEYGTRAELLMQHLFIKSDDTSYQYSFVKLPGAFAQKGIVGLGYQFPSAFLTRELLPSVLQSVDLEPSVIAAVLNERDSVAFAQEKLAALNLLAAENFSAVFPTWRVVLVDREGRSLEELVGSERTLYLLLFAGIIAVIAVGIIVIVRAAAHEAEVLRLKADFVSNVSHELKTPLTLIRMFGETLESGLVVDEAKRKEFSSIIRTESERLTHLIDNVLDFSKMDAGKKAYQCEEADLVDVVRSTVEAYRFHARDMGFEIESHFSVEPIFVQIDKDAISQAIVNVLSNATKYSEAEKYIRVEVAQQGPAAKISVEDRGVGIPRESLGRIFEKFYRAPGDKTRETRGTGLGLTLTKHIVEAHRGTIEVESTLGKGSIFTIRIPMESGEPL